MKKFNFFIPAKISKSIDENGVEDMFLEGVASDPSKDIEGDNLNPKGFDTDYFMKNGLVKWEHDKTPSSFIGQPENIKVTRDNEFYIKAKLWKESQLARDTYELAEVLEKSGTDRRMGWSIEGNALETDPKNKKKITKAAITNVVLTMNPVNPNTWASISKGLNKELYIENEFDSNEDQCLLDVEHDGICFKMDKDFKITKSINKSEKKRDLQELINEHENLLKILKDGNEDKIKAEIELQSKELEEYKKELSKLEKDMNTVNAAALKVESVEGDLKNQEHNAADIKKSLKVILKAIENGLLPREEINKILPKVNI